jgi:curved DNA-binding protein CbpA
MAARRTYYQILYVQPDAPAALIKASHRTLMNELRMHPDLGGDHAHAVLLNEAFATLSDAARRSEYDRVLALRAAQSRQEPATPHAPSFTPSPKTHQADRKEGDDAGRCPFCDIAVPPGTIDFPDAVCTACGCALFPARKHQAGDASRRAIERIPRNMPMTFRRSACPEEVWSAATEDLSLNGMRFLSQAEMEVGERLKVDCQFCTAVAIVRSAWAESEPHAPRRSHFGVEFLTLRLRHARGGLLSTIA